jgi:hypothetical protein
MSAKELHLAPISATLANATVRRLHYSGKVVNNSQVHIGVFWNGQLEGAMQFGPSLDKRKLIGLVEGTGWNEFIELNRMAFSEALPRNSESRAIAVALRLLKAHAPHLKWVVSFADGAQCGDGTIYRAAGFVLTGVKENKQILELPDGFRCAGSVLNMLGPKGGEKVRQEVTRRLSRTSVTKSKHIMQTGASSLKPYLDAGAKFVPGHQLRYLYFLDPTARERLTVPILPFSEIDRLGAGMYRGKPRVSRLDSEATGTTGEGRCDATDTLQSSEGMH